MPHTTGDPASVPRNVEGPYERSSCSESDPRPTTPAPTQPLFKLLPSHGKLHDFPFQLSDPGEYTPILKELSRLGYSNSAGFIAEKHSNRTFLLRIVPVEEELAMELIAVFEGDVLSPRS